MIRDFFSAVKIEKFQLKNFIIFHIFAPDIDCRYKLKLPHQGCPKEFSALSQVKTVISVPGKVACLCYASVYCACLSVSF